LYYGIQGFEERFAIVICVTVVNTIEATSDAFDCDCMQYKAWNTIVTATSIYNLDDIINAKMKRRRDYPIARTVRAHAIAATEAADGKLSEVHERIWLSPEINDPTPTTPAIKANNTKNPVAAFPIGKYMGEK